jgi:iron complex transport system ATP-binding protein
LTERALQGGQPVVIQMRGVSCVMDGRRILRGVDWTVRRGEHWAVVGLNGSGKTTLLKMINGYVFPSSGQMRVLGKAFGSYDWREMRRKIGFVSSFLQEKFYAAETAEEIVLSGLFATIGLYDRPKRSDVLRARRLLGRLGCGRAAGQPYEELSQGEKQKTLIARALLSAPRIVVLDEPCAGLDLFARERLLDSIEGLIRHRRSPTLLYVTHHIEEITPGFTHALLLRRGEVHSAGDKKKVLSAGNLSSFFETPVEVRWRDGRATVHI